MATQQDPTDGRYRAVVSVSAPGLMAAPKRDVADGAVTALLELVSLTDQTGAPIGTSGNPLITSTSGAPTGTQTPTSNSSGNVAAAPAVATLAAVAGKTTYMTGFQVTATGNTNAATVVNVTVAGVAGGPLTYAFVFPTGTTTPAQPLFVDFGQPLAASAPNTAITVTLPAGGAGNTNASVSAQGYQQ